MKRICSVAALLGAMMAASGAMAWEAGDWIVRGGAVNVDPDTDSGNLKVEGTSVPGTGVDVDDDTQVMLTVTYMASDSVGVELLAATPFTHDVTVDGLDALGVPNGSKLGDLTHLPPTLSALWYPMGSGSKFQPYFGLGVNYTIIWDEELTNAAKNLLGARNLDIDDSLGWAARAGFDVELSERLSLNAGVWYINLETEAELNTALGKVKVDVDVNPWVYGLGIGYKF